MEKQTNHKSLKKLTIGALAIILASTVVFPVTNVLADETTSETAIIDLQENTSSDSDKVQKPSLLPGDFFYFTKIILEKIHLALTIDDVKEAKLIAEYAAERLSEAEALFAGGSEEAAIETMKKAIDNIEVAEDHVTNVEEESSGEVVKDENELEQAKEAVSQNIITLTTAMEKVKNPVAKAALQKNIEKSYAKLAKKMEKWEKKHQKKTKEYTVEESVATPEIEPGIETNTPEVEEAPDVTLPLTPQPSIKETQQTAVQGIKQSKQETLQQVKEAKTIGKEKKEEIKQAVKEKKKEIKGNNGKGN